MMVISFWWKRVIHNRLLKDRHSKPHLPQASVVSMEFSSFSRLLRNSFFSSLGVHTTPTLSTGHWTWLGFTSSAWSYRSPSCRRCLRLPFRSTRRSLGVNVTHPCKNRSYSNLPQKRLNILHLTSFPKGLQKEQPYKRDWKYISYPHSHTQRSCTINHNTLTQHMQEETGGSFTMQLLTF